MFEVFHGHYPRGIKARGEAPNQRFRFRPRVSIRPLATLPGLKIKKTTTNGRWRLDPTGLSEQAEGLLRIFLKEGFQIRCNCNARVVSLYVARGGRRESFVGLCLFARENKNNTLNSLQEREHER